MFIKLFETSNVANNLLGLALKIAISLRFLAFELDIFFKSVLEREKTQLQIQKLVLNILTEQLLIIF